MAKTKTTHDIAELNRLYDEAESCDKDVFAEMRSSLLLISGEHYQRRQAEIFRRIRESKDLSDQQKIRLTKNHIQRIYKTYVNNIVSMAPGVGFSPKNPSELKDQKASELHHSVWVDLDDRHSIQTELVDDWADDYVGIGEVACKVFWDPNAGEISGYNQSVDEEGAPLFYDMNWNPTLEPTPNMVPDYDSPVYRGDFVFEEIYGFNLLRSPDAKDMRKSPYLIIRKMVDTDKLIADFADGNPDVIGMFQASEDETLVVFDANKGGYQAAKKQCMVREFYFRPCAMYPRGYFYFTTKAGIFAKDELPGGVFPIAWRHFDKVQTSPRGRGVVKPMRPYQAEINRAASKMAEHQITLGDDKLLIQNGTKISSGASLPGVRAVNYTGVKPEILNGRDGSQYLGYMQSQIAEMYQVMNVAEDMLEKDGQTDPYVMLFRAASQKKKFQRYIRGFERFLMDITEIALKLAKLHLPDDAVIYAVGKPEMVNIQEFRDASDLCYQIKISPQADDIETKMGKQIMLDRAIQYGGAKMTREDLGKFIKQMPYANIDSSLDDLTLDYDSATNMILALDRGEYPELHGEDDYVYLLKRLGARMRQADFRFMNPQVKANYERMKFECQERQAQRLIQLQRLKDGFIPTGGYLVTCDFYVPVPGQPGKTQRARIWYDSLRWLIQQLEAQGQGLDELTTMNPGGVAELAPLVAGPVNPGMAQGQGGPGVRPSPMAGPPFGMQGGPAPKEMPSYGRPRIPFPVPVR